MGEVCRLSTRDILVSYLGTELIPVKPPAGKENHHIINISTPTYVGMISIEINKTFICTHKGNFSLRILLL